MAYPSKDQIFQIMSEIEKLKSKGKIRKIKPLSKDASPVLRWKFKMNKKTRNLTTKPQTHGHLVFFFCSSFALHIIF